MQPPSERGKKDYIFRLGNLIKMAAMPIYVKTLKNLLLQNHNADCLETWYVASEDLVYLSLYKLGRWVDLDLFYGKVKYDSSGFCMEKKLKNAYSVAIVVLYIIMHHHLTPMKL